MALQGYRRDCEEWVYSEKDPKYLESLEKEKNWLEWYPYMYDFFGNHQTIESHLDQLVNSKTIMCPKGPCVGVKVVKKLDADDQSRIEIGVDENRIFRNKSGEVDPDAVRALDALYNFTKSSKIEPDFWIINTQPQNQYKWYLPYYIFPKIICSHQARTREQIKDMDARHKRDKKNSLKPKPQIIARRPEFPVYITGPNGIAIGKYYKSTKTFEPYINPQVLSMKDVKKVVEDMQWLRKASVQDLNKYLDKKIPELRSNKKDVYPSVYKEITDKFFQKDLKTPEYF